jgi:glycosyltransferase involved in cell wall biosynthesis
MRILRVIDTLDPRTGGPGVGVRAITPVLHALGHQTTILTCDTPGAADVTVPGAEVIPLGPAKGSYRHCPALRPWLQRNLPRFDAAFVHGLWQSPGRAVHLAAREHGVPYFVYPHGMLDPWFRRAYPAKHIKKWLYWQLVERHVLRDAAAVIFTCDEERRLARQSFSPYHCVERVVNYGTAGAPAGNPAQQIEAWKKFCPALGERPFLLFLGRIHPKKGVDLLLHAYQQLVARTAHPPALVVAGPAENPELVQHLKTVAKSLPSHAAVHWPGLLQGDAKWGALRAAEAFVLPSHQENFGLAVAESLAVGTPVLLSHQVNIWREIIDDRAGLAAPDTADGTSLLLADWQKLSADERAAMRTRAADCYARRFNIDAVARSFLDVVQPFLRTTPARVSP